MKITTQVNYTGLPRKHGVFDAFLIRSLSQPWGFHRFLAQVNASSALKLKQHSCRGANCNHWGSKGFPGISWYFLVAGPPAEWRGSHEENWHMPALLQSKVHSHWRVPSGNQAETRARVLTKPIVNRSFCVSPFQFEAVLP